MTNSFATALRTAIMAAAFLLPAAGTLFAQAEHVWTEHPVYLFLDRMQTRGLIEGYSRAMLPMERKQVTLLLRRLEDRRSEMSATEQSLLGRYADEFVAEADGTAEQVSLFETPLSGWIDESVANKEKFLYAWESEDRQSTFRMEFLGSVEYRAQFEADGPRNVTLARIGGRFRGTLGGIFGYGLRATNGTSFGDKALALQDPELSGNFVYSSLDNPFFDQAEAYVSGTWGWGSLSLGREKTIIGNGLSNQAIISTNARPFDALRFNIHVGDVRFTYLHGWLLSQAVRLETGQDYYPEKYIAMHRLEADLFSAVRLGVFESVIYSHRGLDPAYLIPVNFFKTAEHAGGDRDNPMLGIDLQTLSLYGSELHGTWVIDDIDFGRMGSDWWGNKFVMQAGFVNHSWLPNTELSLEYTRVKPYTYSHRYRDNEYTHDRMNVATSIAPNSDECYAGIRHWIGSRLILNATFEYRRHGANELDQDGNIVVNNGGDIEQSRDYGRDSEFAPFLAGPLEQQRILTFLFSYEAWRNIIFAGRYRYRSYDLYPDLSTVQDHYVSIALQVEY